MNSTDDGPRSGDKPSFSAFGLWARLRTLFFGKAKDPLAPDVFHRVSLVAFLAWVGFLRSLLLVLRPGGGVPGAERAYVSRHSLGAVHGGDHLCDLGELLPTHRALPDRRGGL